jgi:hypothetical protein
MGMSLKLYYKPRKERGSKKKAAFAGRFNEKRVSGKLFRGLSASISAGAAFFAFHGLAGVRAARRFCARR